MDFQQARVELVKQRLAGASALLRKSSEGNTSLDFNGARLELLRQRLEKAGFDPSQERDWHGRWSGGGGGATTISGGESAYGEGAGAGGGRAYGEGTGTEAPLGHEGKKVEHITGHFSRQIKESAAEVDRLTREHTKLDADRVEAGDVTETAKWVEISDRIDAELKHLTRLKAAHNNTATPADMEAIREYQAKTTVQQQAKPVSHEENIRQKQAALLQLNRTIGDRQSKRDRAQNELAAYLGDERHSKEDKIAVDLRNQIGDWNAELYELRVQRDAARKEESAARADAGQASATTTAAGAPAMHELSQMEEGSWRHRLARHSANLANVARTLKTVLDTAVAITGADESHPLSTAARAADAVTTLSTAANTLSRAKDATTAKDAVVSASKATRTLHAELPKLLSEAEKSKRLGPHIETARAKIKTAREQLKSGAERRRYERELRAEYPRPEKSTDTYQEALGRWRSQREHAGRVREHITSQPLAIPHLPQAEGPVLPMGADVVYERGPYTYRRATSYRA